MEARRGVLAGQMPYGAAVVRNGRVIAFAEVPAALRALGGRSTLGRTVVRVSAADQGARR